jgi:serine/threonine protein kinase
MKKTLPVQLAKSGKAHFKILDSLGQGAQGEVFKVSDRKDRLFAVKRYDKTNDDSVQAQRRARKVGEILPQPQTGSLKRAWMLDNGYDSNDNPIMLYRLFNETPLENYHTKYIPSNSLQHREKIALGITAGIVEIHRKGIIHADLAPINILTAADGRVAIIDFDGAGYVNANGSSLAPIVAGHPHFPGWVSPREIIKEKATFKTDIWWLGSLIMKSLTGYNPFFFLKVVDESSINELYELIGDTRIEWPPPYGKIKSHSKLQAKLTETVLDNTRKVLNNTITTAVLGDIFRGYYNQNSRPKATEVWSAFRGRCFR